MDISGALVYLIKTMVILGVFYAFYFLFLRQQVSHGLNRIYLLITLIISLIIPFIELSVPQEVRPIMEIPMFEWIAEPIDNQQNISTIDKSLSFWSVIQWIYIGIVFAFIVRSFLHLYFLKKIKNSSECISKHWFTLFKTSYTRSFSFFSSVFIPKAVFGSTSFDQILAHECVHVQRFHSLDRLLVDFFVSLFWFNPFIYLYRNALIEIHEYEADAAVIAKFGDPIGYQEMLFAQLQPACHSDLVSHFNFSTIKKRIVMMNKARKADQSRLAYVFTVPMVALVLLAFTSKEGIKSASQLADKIESISNPISSQVKGLKQQEDRFRPSILPLKVDAKFKVSSGYGLRNDPNSGTNQMHKGIDLACAIGTEVLAAADGEISEVVASPDGYGNHISINHGDRYITVYAQLSDFKVKGGDQVMKGQVIGLTGNSGKSTGPHLHFEVYDKGETVNPMDYIKNFSFKVSSIAHPNKRIDDISSTSEPTDQELFALKMAKEAELAAGSMRELSELEMVKAELAMVQAVKAKDAAKAVIVDEVRISQEAQVARIAELEAVKAMNKSMKERMEISKIEMKMANERLREDDIKTEIETVRRLKEINEKEKEKIKTEKEKRKN